MKNKIYIGISLAILAVGGYLVYTKFLVAPTRTKEENIAIIVSNNFSLNKNNLLLSFDDGFLNEWATAVTKGKKTFNYNRKDYNTQGGTALKK